MSPAGEAGAGGVPAAAALIDGRPARTPAVLDRGLHFGDGLFETMACVQGRARFLSLHLERLVHGCERLHIGFTHWSALRAEIEQQAAAAPAALLKLILTRGTATARGYAPHGDELPTRILLRYPWPAPDPELARSGVRLRTAQLRLGENPTLAGMKHLNRLEQVLARSEWTDPQVHEALLFSSSGMLISGTMSNVFLVRAGRLLTPRLDRCGVLGVLRRVVMREAAGMGIEVEERKLEQADLDGAGEIFMTNARIGIWPVRRLDERVLAVGSTTRQLQRALEPLLQAPADA